MTGRLGRQTRPARFASSAARGLDNLASFVWMGVVTLVTGSRLSQAVYFANLLEQSRYPWAISIPMLLPRAGVKYYTTATQIGQGQQVCRLPRSIDLAVFVLNPQATLSIVSCMRGSTATSQTMGLVAHYELLSREYWGMGVHDAGGNVLRPLIDGCRKQVPSSSYTVSEVDG